MAYIKLLKNVPLDNSYSNPILFSDAVVPDGMVKVTYDNFFSKYSDNGVWMPSVNDLHMNIRIGDGINTTIIVPDAQWQPSYNYAIIRFTENEIKPCQYQVDGSGRVNQPFFYFITNCVPLGKGGYVLTLELDVMTTYFSHIKLDHQIFTERKHCNRFRYLDEKYTLQWKDAVLGDNIDGSFNANVIDKVVYPDFIYVNRDSVNLDAVYNALNKELTKYQWVYLFFTKLPQDVGETEMIEDAVTMKIAGKDGNYVDTQVYCMAFPTKEIAININYTDDNVSEGIDYGVDTMNYKYIIEQAGCIGAKLSNRPPFDSSIIYDNTNTSYIGTTNNFTKIVLSFNVTLYSNFYSGANNNIAFIRTRRGKTTDKFYTFLLVKYINEVEVLSKDVNIGENFNIPFMLSDELLDIINQYKSTRLYTIEPKLYCKPFYNVVLSSQYGTAYNYNLLMLNEEKLNISVFNGITPEPEKIYTYIKSGNGSPYRLQKICNIGSTIINDNNIPYKSDAYAQYLSSHRSSVITGLAMPVVNGVVGVASSIMRFGASGGKKAQTGGMIGGVVGSVQNAGNELVNYASNICDLQNTPDSIKNMGNNPIHDMYMKNNTHPYIVVNELLGSEKQQVYDYFYDYGYKINRKCYLNVKEFTNTEQIITRQKFNYVKINDNIVNEIEFFEENPRGNITYFVPQIVKQKINSILNRGCKLWTLIYKNQTGATWQDFYLGSDFENAEISMP